MPERMTPAEARENRTRKNRGDNCHEKNKKSQPYSNAARSDNRKDENPFVTKGFSGIRKQPEPVTTGRAAV